MYGCGRELSTVINLTLLLISEIILSVQTSSGQRLSRPTPSRWGRWFLHSFSCLTHSRTCGTTCLHSMAKKKPNEHIVWRLRVPRTLVARVKEIAIQEKRSTTREAECLLEFAVKAYRVGAYQVDLTK